MHNKGQNIAETAIILAVIAVAAIGILTVLGQNIDSLFGSSNIKVKEFQPFGKPVNNMNSPENLVAGSLGGKENAPVSQCKSGKCVIDFGNYILTGIPENFQEYVNSSGSSGGTEQLAVLFNQIADQLEEQGDSAGSDDFKYLATITDSMAIRQSRFETKAKTCLANPDANTCFKYNFVSSGIDLDMQEKLIKILPEYDYINMKDYSKDPTDSYLGSSRLAKINADPKWNPEKYPTDAFIEKFDSIMANPKYSDNLKGITRELTDKMNTIGFKMDVDLSVLGPTGTTVSGYVDPVSGEYKSQLGLSSLSVNLNDFIEPNIPFEMSLLSGLLCSAGGNPNDGTSCK